MECDGDGSGTVCKGFQIVGSVRARCAPSSYLAGQMNGGDLCLVSGVWY